MLLVTCLSGCLDRWRDEGIYAKLDSHLHLGIKSSPNNFGSVRAINREIRRILKSKEFNNQLEYCVSGLLDSQNLNVATTEALRGYEW